MAFSCAQPQIMKGMPVETNSKPLKAILLYSFASADSAKAHAAKWSKWPSITGKPGKVRIRPRGSKRATMANASRFDVIFYPVK